MFGLIVLYLAVFSVSHLSLYPTTLPPILIIKATGTLAIFMLHIILIMGPLVRLDQRFLPLLYNRRHVGVTMFVISLIHGVFSLFFYHGSGVVNPVSSLFTSNIHYDSFSRFPYMTLGFTALLIFAAMAITSHDRWNNKLGARGWKNLHMAVYLAYALVIIHVATGALQGDINNLANWILYFGIGLVAILHILAAFKSRSERRLRQSILSEGFVSAGMVNAIDLNRAKIVNHKNESIAIFRHNNSLSAISNYCKHQGGPLGEGKIVDGYITCPWHGYQYYAHNGTSPPPFEEKVATYDVKVVNEEVFVKISPNPIGSDTRPCAIDALSDNQNDDEFYIGWSQNYPIGYKKKSRLFLSTLVVLVIALGFLVPRSMETLKDSTYEFTAQKKYTGILIKEPVAMLRVVKNGQIFDHMLVNFGKKSALPTINAVEKERGEDLHGRKVNLTVTEMSYKGRKVFELTDEKESFLKIGRVTDIDNSMRALGSSNLRGEIVDPKCFFGAMNPGEGKVHRSCAALCLRGGIPAVLATGKKESQEYYIIKGADGENINMKLLDIVGEDVKMAGTIYELNNWKYIYVGDVKEIHRLSFRNILEGDKGPLCNVELPNQKEL